MLMVEQFIFNPFIFFSRLIFLFILIFSFSCFAASKRFEKDLNKVSKLNSFIDDQAKLYLEGDIGNKKDILLIIYNHGSDDETKLDLCTREWNNVPPVILQLHNQKINNLIIKIYRLCSGVRGWSQDEKDRIGDEVRTTGTFRIELADKYKVKLIDKYKQLNKQKIIINKVNEFLMQGFENIILVGHSAGAWASLNLQSRFSKKIDGVIAFNPAFTGTKKNRGQYKMWDILRSHEINIISKSSEINALVFTHEEDDHETPDTLSFLKNFNKLHFIDYSKIECKGHGHRIPVWSIKVANCFAEFDKKNNYIVNYLESIF